MVTLNYFEWSFYLGTDILIGLGSLRLMPGSKTILSTAQEPNLPFILAYGKFTGAEEMLMALFFWQLLCSLSIKLPPQLERNNLTHPPHSHFHSVSSHIQMQRTESTMESTCTPSIPSKYK